MGRAHIFDIIMALLDETFVSNINLKKLTTNTFSTSNLVGKTVNICDDEKLGKLTKIMDTEILKSIIGGRNN